MAFPYLAGYLEVAGADGSCVEVFNSCRAKWNLLNRPESAGAGWKVTDAENADVWSDCCCWSWDEGDYSQSPDPWFDANNPATLEVAGVVVDAGDGSGHGFYLEPSSSTRVLGSNVSESLEMYATFTVVAGSARGERAFLNWLDSVLTDICNRCDGLELTVFTECACEDDFIDAGAIFDDNGCLVYSFPDSLPPVRGPICEVDPECLEPYDGPDVEVVDTGERQVVKASYAGIEPLFEGVDLCGGNRYKISFDVEEHCWFSPARKLWSLGEFVDCTCLCTGVYDICDDCVTTDVCGDTVQPVSSLVRSPSSVVLDTLDGLICTDSRFSRADKVMVDAELTPPMPSSLSSVLEMELVNNSGAEVKDIRVCVWEAVDGLPRPDVEKGWAFYKDLPTVYCLDIYSVKDGDVLSVTASGGVSVARSGLVCSGGRVSEISGCLDLGCGKRYWVALEVPCGYDVEGLTLDVSAVFKEPI